MKKVILTLGILLLTCNINAQDFLNSAGIGYDYMYGHPRGNKHGYVLHINVVNIYMELVSNFETKQINDNNKPHFHAGEINLGYSFKIKSWGCPYNINCLKSTTSAAYITPIIGCTNSDPINPETVKWNEFSKLNIGFNLSYRYKRILISSQLTNNKIGLLIGCCF